MEYVKDFGLNLNLARYRSYDPAVGRFLQIDPEVEQFYSLTPYNGMLNNPILYADPQGDCPACVGAIIGAALDVVVQTAEIALTDKTLSEFSVKSVVVSGMAGATGVGVAQNVKNLGYLGKVGVDLATDAAISVTSQAINEGEVTIENTMTDVAIGRGARETVGRVMKNKAVKSKKGRQLQAEVNAQENIAQRGSSTRGLKKGDANVKGAQNELDNFTAGKSAVGAGAAAGATRKATKRIELPPWTIDNTEPRDNTIIKQNFEF